VARFKISQREEAYRIYITDAFKGYFGLNIRLYDILYPVEEERTPNEIIDGIRAKLRG